ncbi:hypothetical protein Dimus_030458 [Dionaea muscipula]
MFRGSPSPLTTFHRRPALSPGPQARHLRSPSPVVRSSVDPDDFSTSEAGEGDSTELAFSSSEEEENEVGNRPQRLRVRIVAEEKSIQVHRSESLLSGASIGRLESSRFFLLSPVIEDYRMHERSVTEEQSSSSTISPKRAALLYKNAIVDGGDEDDRMSLARSESASSFSSPFLNGGYPMSGGVRKEVIAWADEHGGPDLRGGADLATVVSTVSSPCHSPPCRVEPLVTGPLDVGLVVDDAEVLGSSAGVAVVSGGEVPTALQIGDRVQAVATSSMIIGRLPPLCGGIVASLIPGGARERF